MRDIIWNFFTCPRCGRSGYDGYCQCEENDMPPDSWGD